MRLSLRQNPLLLLGLGVELGLILFIVYTPWGNRIFATQAFEPMVWVLILALALSFGGLEAGRKYLVRRGL
jgi:magnesium-transporting ATPase (P-type)